MLALAAEGASEGSWLRAERQTQGRGRQGRLWQSSPLNLAASTLVRAAAADPPPASLALVAGLALLDALRRFAPEAAFQLKWPNDVLTGGAKLSGILLERAGDAVVIGFGVNLAEHPDLPDRRTASLASLGLTPPDPDQFCAALVDTLAARVALWRHEGLPGIAGDWLAAAHPAGTPLLADTGDGGRIAGTFEGLDAEGALLLRLANGEIRAIHAGDVMLAGGD